MRALYLAGNSLLEHLLLNDKDKLHHLLNVIRVRQNENVLVLNGIGQSRVYSIEEIQKKSIKLISKSQIVTHKKFHNISFLIGKTKKDDLSIILKSCVEVGAKNIIIANTDFSQKYDLNIERINTIIEQAIEQSNNPFMPVFSTVENLMSLDYAEYESVIVFDNNQENEKLNPKSSEILILIGPEGGFSSDEILELNKLQNMVSVHLKLPIMRATTAVNVAFGFIFGSSK